MTFRRRPQSDERPKHCAECGKPCYVQRTPCRRLVCAACYAVITAPAPEPAAKPARKARVAK